MKEIKGILQRKKMVRLYAYVGSGGKGKETFRPQVYWLLFPISDRMPSVREPLRWLCILIHT